MSRSPQRSSRRSPVWALAPLAVLVFAGWQTVAVLSRTPAFNPELRVEVPQGQRIPQYTNAYYDRAEYRFWAARLWYDSYRYAAYDAAVTSGAGLWRFEDRAAAAVAASLDDARASLTYSPGDPMTWMLVATAELAAGDRDRALTAYRNSYVLAPYNAMLATQRLDTLISILGDARHVERARLSGVPEIVRSDLRTMDPRDARLKERLTTSPVLSEIAKEHDEGS